MRVAVIGASGVIGRALLDAADDRHELVAVARRIPTEQRPGVEWVAADATHPEAMRRVLDGIEAVVYLVHSLGSADFEQRDRVAAATVAEAAGHSGVRQIVYVGGLGDDDPNLSAHLRSRRETGEVLASGDVPVTTLRSGVVIGAGSAAFETIVALVDRLPAMICPRWVVTPTQPIAIDDVVSYLQGVLGLDATLGDTFDIGGPEVITYREMIERIGVLRGHRPLIVEVPVLTPRLSSYWLHLVTPVKASVARPLIDGLRNPTVVRDERIRDLVPLELTGFDEAARRALAGRS